jgi:hypothetical protein
MSSTLGREDGDVSARRESASLLPRGRSCRLRARGQAAGERSTAAADLMRLGGDRTRCRRPGCGWAAQCARGGDQVWSIWRRATAGFRVKLLVVGVDISDQGQSKSAPPDGTGGFEPHRTKLDTLEHPLRTQTAAPPAGPRRRSPYAAPAYSSCTCLRASPWQRELLTAFERSPTMPALATRPRRNRTRRQPARSPLSWRRRCTPTSTLAAWHPQTLSPSLQPSLLGRPSKPRLRPRGRR